MTKLFKLNDWSEQKMHHIQHVTKNDKTVRDVMKRFMTHTSLNNALNSFKNDELYIGKSAGEIAHILYNYPLDQLLFTIENTHIDGSKIIDIFWSENNNPIQINLFVGWEQNEVDQIKLMLQKYWSLTKHQFIDNINKVLCGTNYSEIPTTLRDGVKHILSENEDFDIEQLCYKIKNNKPIDNFRDELMNKIEQLIQSYSVENQVNNDEVDVKQIYRAISECFVYNYVDKNMNVKPRDWICSNCGNYNFSKCIGGHIYNELHTCSLCGIEQIDSVFFKISNYHDTFLMVNEVIDINDEEVKDMDEIDSLIQEAIKAKKCKLICPKEVNNVQCEAMLRLARNLLIYKRWIHALKGSDDVDKT
eukprot:23554_1